MSKPTALDCRLDMRTSNKTTATTWATFAWGGLYLRDARLRDLVRAA